METVAAAAVVVVVVAGMDAIPALSVTRPLAEDTLETQRSKYYISGLLGRTLKGPVMGGSRFNEVVRENAEVAGAAEGGPSPRLPRRGSRNSEMGIS